jgi:hypothetical protein
MIENKLVIHSKNVVTGNLDLTIYQHVENVTKIGVSTNTGLFGFLFVKEDWTNGFGFELVFELVFELGFVDLLVYAILNIE